MQATAAAAVLHRTTSAVSDLVSETAEDGNATTTTALARLQYALQKVRHKAVYPQLV